MAGGPGRQRLTVVLSWCEGLQKDSPGKMSSPGPVFGAERRGCPGAEDDRGGERRGASVEWGGARAGAMVGLSSEGGELTINRFGGGVRLWDEGRVFPGVLGVGSPAEEVRGNLGRRCAVWRCAVSYWWVGILSRGGA